MTSGTYDLITVGGGLGGAALAKETAKKHGRQYVANGRADLRGALVVCKLPLFYCEPPTLFNGLDVRKMGTAVAAPGEREREGVSWPTHSMGRSHEDRLDDGSRMRREAPVRFCEGLRVQFPRSTHLRGPSGNRQSYRDD